MINTFREAAKLAEAASPEMYGPEGIFEIVGGLEDDTDYLVQGELRPGFTQDDIPYNSSLEFISKATGEVWYQHFSQGLDKAAKMRPAK